MQQYVTIFSNTWSNAKCGCIYVVRRGRDSWSNRCRSYLRLYRNVGLYLRRNVNCSHSDGMIPLFISLSIFFNTIFFYTNSCLSTKRTVRSRCHSMCSSCSSSELLSTAHTPSSPHRSVQNSERTVHWKATPRPWQRSLRSSTERDRLGRPLAH